MTILQLKQLGHDLLSEYQDLAGVNSELAYKELEKNMKGKPPHFHGMKSKAELQNALGTLKKMIIKLKIQDERTNL